VFARAGRPCDSWGLPVTPALEVGRTNGSKERDWEVGTDVVTTTLARR
jgi:hypothetical protein